MFRLLRLEDRIVLDGAALTDLLDEMHSQEMHEQQMADADAQADDASAADDIGIDTDAMLYIDDVAADDTGTHVLVISSEVKDGEILAAAAKDNVIVVKYNPEKTTLDDLSAMIKDALGGEKADSIAFASHYTNTGIMALSGSDAMSADSLESDAEQQEFWKSVGEMVDDGGRIDLLACDVAGKDGGEEFVSQIESISGVNVAASVDPTGNEAYGGDWVLETDNVDVQATYFESAKLEKFDELLGAQPPVKANDVVNRVYNVNAAGKWDSVYFKLNPNYTDTTGDQIAVLPIGTSTNYYGWVFTDPDDPNTSTSTPLTYSAAFEDGTSLNYPNAGIWLTFLPGSRTFTGNPNGADGIFGTADDNVKVGDDMVIVLTATDPSGNVSTNTETFIISFRNPIAGTGLVTLGITGSPMAEAGGKATVTAYLSTAAPVGGVTVYLNDAGVGATAEAGDFILSPDAIFITQGYTSGTATITAQNDADGDNELVVIEIDSVSGTNFQESGYQAVSATIIDDDVSTAPTVTLGISSNSVNEGGAAATVTAYLSSAAPTGGITVTLGTTGNYEANDFTLSATTFTIAEGTKSKAVTFTALEDADLDNEAVTLSIASAPGASLGSPSVVNATIVDNDFPTVTLGMTPATMTEGTGATVTAYLSSPAPTGGITVTMGYTGTYELGDFTAENSIFIPAGSSSVSIPFMSNQDTDVENEAVTLSIASAPGVNIGTPSSVNATIVDDDVITVSLKASSSSFSEKDGNTVITATLSKANTTNNVVVSLTYTGTDVSADLITKPASMTILAGQTTQSITLSGKDDALIEGPENFTVGISAVTYASTGSPSTVPLTILDDDYSYVSLGVSASSFNENGGSAKVTAYLDQPAGPGGVTVDLNFAGTALGTDYNVTGDPIFIAAGTTSSFADIAPVNDEIVEGNETIDITILSVGGQAKATTGASNSVSTSIVDDDAVYVTLGMNNLSLLENGGTSTLTAYLSKTTGQPVTVNLSYAGAGAGVAGLGVDYNAANSIVIAANAPSNSITIQASSDLLVEGNESIIVTGTPENASVYDNIPPTATAYIIDDEVNTVKLSLTGTPFAENGGTALVTATLDQISANPVVVELGFAGTATFDTDYTAATSITIPAGQLSKSIELKGSSDSLVDIGETVIVDITGVSGATEATPAQQVTAEITDDDAPIATLGFGTAGKTTISLAEVSGQSTPVTLYLDKPAPAGGVTVYLTLTGTATQNADYAMVGGTTLYIAQGGTTVSKTLQAVNDTWFEGNETVSVAIGSITGPVSKGSPDVLIATIVDDEAPPTVTLDLNPATVNEGATAVVTATLSKPGNVDITVDLSVTGGTVLAADYNVITTHILISAGQTTGTVSIGAVTDIAVEGPETVLVDIAYTNASKAQAPLTLTIADMTALPTVTLGISTPSFIEKGGEAVVTAYMTSTSYADVTVNLDFTGTALSSGATDYNVTPATYIVIPKNSTTASITLQGVDDSFTEQQESITVSIKNVSAGANTAAPAPVTTAIIDNEGTPYVSLSLSNACFAENKGTTQVIATLTQPTFQNVTVNLGFTGTALLSGATDYTHDGAVIVITAGATTGFITLTGVDDSNKEPEETVEVSITSAQNASLGADTAKTAYVTDDDEAPGVTLSPLTASFAEATAATTFVATLDAVTMETVNIELGLAGTAMYEIDYTATSTLLTIAPGGTTASITLTAKQDTVDELDETVVVDIVSVQGAVEKLAQTVTATLVDDDDAPVLTLSKEGILMLETGGLEVINATLSAASSLPVTVTLSLSGGTAQIGTDYTVSEQTFVIPPTVTSYSVTLNSVHDCIYEGDETIVVGVASLVNATTSTAATLSVTLLEDDNMPSVTLGATNATFYEINATPAQVVAYLSQASALTTTIDLIFIGTAETTDYTADKAQIVIAAGKTTGAVNLTSSNDLVYEGNETVVVELGALSAGVTYGDPRSATTLLVDNDSVSVSLGISPATVSESGSATVTGYLNGTSEETITLNLVYGGTAVASDFTAMPTTITIPAGTNTSGSITLQTSDDAVYEGSETVTVDSAANWTVSGVSSPASIVGTHPVTGIITDEGDLPKASLSFANGNFAEEGGIDTLIVTLDKTSLSPVTVTLEYTGGTAGASDYTGALTSVVISSGTTAPVKLTGTHDLIFEGTESVSVKITNVEGGTIGSALPVTSSIIDDDSQPNVTLGPAVITVTEGASAVVTAYLDHPSATDVTVTLVSTGGNAEAADYTMVTSLVITAGQTTGSVILSASDDNIYEGAETFTVGIQAVTGASYGTVTPISVNIADNDNAPSVTLSPALSTFPEDTGSTVVTAILSNATELDVTVNLNYAGTAGATDYSAVASGGTTGSLMITAGMTTGSVTLTGTPDTAYEGTESVVVSIASVQNAVTQAADQSVTAAINDQADYPSVTIGVTPSFMENSAGGVVTAYLSQKTLETVTVNLGFAGGTADATDYTPSATFIVINPNDTTGIVNLVPKDDSDYEGDETIAVNITGVTNAVMSTGMTAGTATLAENDGDPSVNLSVNNSEFPENGGSAVVTATLTGKTIKPVTVQLSYAGVAEITTDYSATPAIMTIPAGSTSCQFTLNAIGDELYEGTEGITVSVGALTNATTANSSSASVTTAILDNDGLPTVTLTVGTLNEDAGIALVTATLSQASVETVTLDLGFAGTAASTDYGYANAAYTQIVISSGKTTGTVELKAAPDSIYEGTETVIVSIAGIDGNATTQGVISTATANLIDNDSMPTVTLSAGPLTISEETNATSSVIATMTNPSSQDVTVTLIVSGGTAAVGSDYTLSPMQILIPAGTTNAAATLTALNDDIYETTQTVIVEISTVSTGATENATPQFATVSITSTDAVPKVTLTAIPGSDDESGGLVTLVATMDRASDSLVTVPLDFTGGTATASDYTTEGGATRIIIAAGKTTNSLNIEFTHDVLYELDEFIRVEMGTVDGASESGGAQVVTATILDDDSMPGVTLSLSSAAGTFAEEAPGNTIGVIATLDSAAGTDVTVNLSYAGGTAETTDYTGATYILITAGSTNGMISLTGVTDTVFEGTETVKVSISSLVNAETGTADTSVTASIDDTKDLPDIDLRILEGVTKTTFSENYDVRNVEAYIANGVTIDVPVTVTLNLAGDANAEYGTDYYTTPTGCTIVIPIGSTSAVLTLTGKDDFFDEADGNITVTIAGVENGKDTATNTLAFQIIDDDKSPEISLSVSSSLMEEKGGSIEVTASLSSPAPDTVVVHLGLNGTAEFETDYKAFEGTTAITIPAGQTTGSVVTLVPFNDGGYEGDEAFTITVASYTGSATDMTTQSFSVTIVDDETPPTVNLSLSPAAGTFAEEGGTVDVVATLSAKSLTTVTIDLDFAGTADDTTDYAASAAFIVITAGKTTGSITLTGQTDAATVYEGDESVEVSILSISSAAIPGTDTSVTATIDDEDDYPTVTLTVNPPGTFGENDGTSAVVTATLNNPSYFPVTVELDLAFSGTMHPNGEYTASDTVISIAGDGSATTGFIRLYGLDDNDAEVDEFVLVDILTVSGADTAAGFVPVSVTLVDDDGASVPSVTLGLSNDTFSEKLGTTTVTAYLDHAFNDTVTIGLEFTGTAGYATDYNSADIPGVTLIVITAGNLTGTLVLKGTPDTWYEGDESFTVDVTAAGTDNAIEIGTQQVTATVVDNYTGEIPSVTIDMSPDPVIEGQTTVVTAYLNVASGADVTVDLFFADFSATMYSDYNTAGGATYIFITAGKTTGSIDLPTVHDTVYEGDETIDVLLADVTGGAVIGTITEAAATITDIDDLPQVTLGLLYNQTLPEANGQDTLIAYLSNTSEEPVTVHLDFGGTADWSIDYAIATSIVIDAGQTQSGVLLSAELDTVSDAMAEEDETIEIFIKSVDGGSFTAPEMVTTTIEDDEGVPTVSLTLLNGEMPESGSTAATVVATLAYAYYEDVTVTLAVATGTTVNSTDYLETGTRNIIIPAGELTGTGVILTANEDNVYEGDETISISITDKTPGVDTIAGLDVVTATIIDNEPVPVVNLSLSSPTWLEKDGGTVDVIATLSAVSEIDVTVNLKVTGTADTGTDYSPVVLTQIVIPAGSMSNVATLTATDDATLPSGTVYEGSLDTVIVEIDTISNAAIGTKTSVIATIDDSEDKPSVTLSFSATTADTEAEFAENLGTATVFATLSNPSEVPVTVELAFSGKADIGIDYYVDPDGVSITIAGGTTGSITLWGEPDTLVEGTETAVIDILTVTNGIASTAQTQVTASIVDDTAAPKVSLVLSNSTFMEDGGTTLLTVTLDKPTFEDVTVDLDFSSGTDAEYGTDFTASATYVVIPTGSTSASPVILTGISDIPETLYEESEDSDGMGLPIMGYENLYVNIGAVTGGLATEIGTVFVTASIDDSADLPKVSLTASPGSIAEGTGGTAVVTATLSNKSEADVWVNFGFSGTATDSATAADDDFDVAANFTITAGELTGTMILKADDNDSDYEFQESVIVGIASFGDAPGSNDGATVGSPAETTVTITDEDDKPLVAVSFLYGTLAENGGKDMLQAVLYHPSDFPGSPATMITSAVDTTVTFDFGGTAEFGADYTTDGGVTYIVVPAGQSTGTLMLTGADDSNYEGDETVEAAAAASVVNGSVFPGFGSDIATITDNADEPLVSLSVSGSPFAENSSAVLTATLTAKTINPVTVDLNFTAGGTAAFGSDYTAATYIVIPANTLSASIDLVGMDDSDYEHDESILVEIVTVANASENGTQTATATVTSEDPMPKVTLSLGASSFTEGGSTTVIATLDRLSVDPVTVTLAYTDNGATPVTTDNGLAETGDYDHIATIVVNPGDLTGSAVINAAEDLVYEGPELFEVFVDSVSGGTEDGTQTQIATIDDNEYMEIRISDASVTEGDAPAMPSVSLTVTRTNFDSEYPITVDWTTADAVFTPATANVDYPAFTGTVDLGFTAAAYTGTVNLQVTGDNAVEGNETFEVRLSNASADAVLMDAKGIVTIIEDDQYAEITTNAGLTLDEGKTAVIGSTLLTATDDLPTTATGLIYTVSTGPTQGTLFLDADRDGIVDAGEALGASSTFTQDDIDNGNIKYRHTGTPGADSFAFKVLASGETSGATGTFSITINDVNNAPTANGAFISGVTEGTTGVIGAVANIDDADGDTVTLSLANDYGIFALSSTSVNTSTGPQSVNVTVTGTLDYEYQDKYTLIVNLSDGNGGTGTATIIVGVANNASDNGYADVILPIPAQLVGDGDVQIFDASLYFNTDLTAKSYTFTGLTAGMTDLGDGYLLIDRSVTGDTAGIYTIGINVTFDHFIYTDDVLTPATTFTIEYLAALDFDPLLEAIQYLDADGEYMLPEDGQAMDVNEVMIARSYDAPVYDDAAMYEESAAPAVDPELAEIVALLDQEIIMIDPETARV